MKKYVAALYWSVMTITTIGFGDVPTVTTPERVTAIFAMCGTSDMHLTRI